MRVLALLLCAVLFSSAQAREGNFTIRFSPDADLQAEAEIPFAIHVYDDLHKPVMNAKVTLQIETAQHTDLKTYRAPAIQPGVYVAKPTFASPGQWSVYVEVVRDGELSARTIEYNVPIATAR